MVRVKKQLPKRGAVIELKGPALPVDFEFRASINTKSVFSKCGLGFGRCLGSKSGYREANPENIFIPNANVFSRTRGEIWWGDLDLARDAPGLEEAAKRLRLRLYVLSEYDGRFENAELPFTEVISRAIWHSGGPARIHGLGSIMQEAKLSASDIAILLNVSQRTLLGRHESSVALKMRKRLDDLKHWIELGLPKSWLGGWGRWLKRANPILGGLTPLQKLNRDKELPFGRILLEEWPNEGVASEKR